MCAITCIWLSGTIRLCPKHSHQAVIGSGSINVAASPPPVINVILLTVAHSELNYSLNFYPFCSLFWLWVAIM